MRYHYEKPSFYTSMYGETYFCDHPAYDSCTLYKIRDKGLAVIQQRCDEFKRTRWTEIDEWLRDPLYLHEGFYKYFNDRAETCTDDGLYPTVTIRQIMWALKMKPIPKERWETVFDRRNV